jgi:hypothetical protein
MRFDRIVADGLRFKKSDKAFSFTQHEQAPLFSATSLEDEKQ